MHPVGRLDADTTGLLLFSSDGHLTQTLLNPNSDIEREYEALVVGHVNASALSEQLSNGVKTTEGSRCTLTHSLTLSRTHSLTHSLTHRYTGVFKGALLHSSIEADVPYDSISKQLDLNDTVTGDAELHTHSLMLTHSLTHLRQNIALVQWCPRLL